MHTTKLPDIKINDQNNKGDNNKPNMLDQLNINNLLDDTDRDIESIVLKRFEHELIKNNKTKLQASFEKETFEKQSYILESSKSFNLLEYFKDKTKHNDYTKSNTNIRQLIDQKFKCYENEFRIEWRHLETMPFNPHSRDSGTLIPSENGEDLYLFGGRGHELNNSICK